MDPADTDLELYDACTRLMRSLTRGDDAFFETLSCWNGFTPEGLRTFAEHHRVLPWLARVADHDRAAEALGEPLRDRLRAERIRQQRWVTKLIAQCEEIQGTFAAAGIEGLFLKGLSFGSRLYGDPRLRPQWDVDVLVRRERIADALEALGGLGYDIETNTDNLRPATERLAEIHSRPREARHALGVRRGGQAVDLHWTLRRRLFHRLDHEGFWLRRQAFVVDGRRFETLGDVDALVFLLVGICSDLKRGAARARQLLDLYLLLGDLGGLDWQEFLAARREEGLLALSVNVLAVFLDVWDAHAEFPALATALQRHRRRLAFRGREQALALLTRPRRSARNQAWFRRVYPRSRARRFAWNLTVDLPHNLGRSLAPPGLGRDPSLSQEGGSPSPRGTGTQ